MLNKIRKPFRWIKNRVLHGQFPSVCSDIRDLNLEKYTVAPDVYQEVKSLLDDDLYSKNDFDGHQDDYRKPQTVVRLLSARVRDRIGAVFLPNGTLLTENHWWLPILQGTPACSARFRRQYRTDEQLFYLLGLWSDQYYHWFHDVLPRLHVARKCLPDSCKFLIHESPSAYQLDSLRLMGITTDQLVTQPNKGDLFAQNLWFSSPSGYTTFGSGEALRSVAHRLLGSSQPKGGTNTSKGLRLYVSRQSARDRCVENLDEIRPILESFKFQIVEFETLTLAEQMQLCGNASIIVGPHGAGLTNMIFANRNCAVVEIASEGVVPCYSMMAKQFGLSFTRFMASKTNAGNYWVSPDGLKKSVEIYTGQQDA